MQRYVHSETNNNEFFFVLSAGMIPHKTLRGQAALKRLRVYDGIPPAYEKKRRVCVPSALRVLCLRSGRKYCKIGRLSHEVGWQYQDVVKNLERKRKAKLAVHLKQLSVNKKLTEKARQTIEKAAAPHNAVIRSLGYH